LSVLAGRDRVGDSTDYLWQVPTVRLAPSLLPSRMHQLCRLRRCQPPWRCLWSLISRRPPGVLLMPPAPNKNANYCSQNRPLASPAQHPVVGGCDRSLAEPPRL